MIPLVVVIAGGRKASSSAGIIGSQSVKSRESGGPHGSDVDKKVKGRKRQMFIDTGGLLVTAIMHSADMQDRDGAPSHPAFIHRSFPWLRHVFTDGCRSGRKLDDALRRLGHCTLQVVKRSDVAKGFETLARRWVDERTCV